MIDRDIYFDAVRETLFSGAMSQEQVGLFRPLALVYALLMVGRPAAIVGRVVAIVVNAIQRHPFWSFTHIGEEVTKTVQPLPSLADLNAASAIRLPELVFGVRASRSHPAPCLKHSGTPADLGVSVPGVARALPFFHEAAARLYRPGPEMASHNDFLVAAVAVAKPARSSSNSVGYLNSNEPTKPSVGYVDQFHGRLL